MTSSPLKVKTPIFFARRLEKIPRRFQNEKEKKPFEKCSICGQDLFDPTLSYMINKYYERGALKGELVVCGDCQARLQGETSRRSAEYLDALLERIDLQERYQLVFSNYTDRVERMMAYCILCRSSRFAVESYFEYAECQARHLLISLHPTLVCGSCAQEIFEGLSPESKDSRRRFYDPFLGVPPVPGKSLKVTNGHLAGEKG